jgi:signal peptidase I
VAELMEAAEKIADNMTEGCGPVRGNTRTSVRTLLMDPSRTGNQDIRRIWSREISLNRLRENHHALYYILMVSGWSVLGFFLILFLLLLFSAINPWIHARVIISGSMEPTIKTGSMVIVIPQDEYQHGDIIAFIDPHIGGNVHRIVGEVSRGGVTFFITKGDAATRPDRTPVPIERIEGKIVMIFPYLGYIAYLGFFAILVPIAMLIIYFIRKRRSQS